MKNFGLLAKKIARGINYEYGSHICINVSEFYGTRGETPNLVRMYVVREAYCGDGGIFVNKELYKSGSAINVLFFMIDLLHRLKNEELTDNNERWIAERERKGAVAMMDFIVENYGMKGEIIDEHECEPTT